MIPRTARRGGVKPNSFVAPLRTVRVGAQKLLGAWSNILGTQILLGENDIHSDCVAVMAYNAIANASARKGIITSFPETAPFDLYTTLGGMPADDGLDPAVLFTHWQENAIEGWKLANIESIALDDPENMEEAIIDNGFVFATAMLCQPQMTQAIWEPVGGAKAGPHAFCPNSYIGPYLMDETWGERIPMGYDFLRLQGLNVWRAELVEA